MSRSQPRLITETGLDARVAAIAEPVVEDLGFQLVRVKCSARDGMTVQIMAERPDGSMSVVDCEEISRMLSPVLDADDPISRDYHLEVSSPGLDRPLVRLADFERATGQEAKLEFSRMLEGRKRFRGILLGVRDDTIGIRQPDADPEGRTEFWLPSEALSEARLVVSEDIIRAALRAAKKGEAADEADAPASHAKTTSPGPGQPASR